MASLGDLARRFALSAELVTTSLASRVGTVIAGRLEGGVIYTPAHLARVRAQLRGALRGAAAPVSLAALVRQLGLEGVGSLGALVPGIVEELVAAGAVEGRLAGGGGTWTPAAYVRGQQQAVRRFYSQSGYISFDTVGRGCLAPPPPPCRRRSSSTSSVVPSSCCGGDGALCCPASPRTPPPALVPPRCPSMASRKPSSS